MMTMADLLQIVIVGLLCTAVHVRPGIFRVTRHDSLEITLADDFMASRRRSIILHSIFRSRLYFLYHTRQHVFHR
jgi:hypothetical protein